MSKTTHIAGRASFLLRSIQATDCAMTDIVRTGYVRQYFSRLAASKGFSPLVIRQFRLTPKDNPSCLCALPSLAGASSDKFPFELSKSAQYCKHQAAMRCRRVRPGISQGFKAGTFFSNRPQEVKKISRGPRQSIEAGDHQHVPVC